jgi:hypothetical protein
MDTGPLATLTVEAALVPPGPVQVNVKVVVVASGPVLAVPLEACAPLQPPVAVQEVAFVELHVNEAALPAATAAGLAVNAAVGTTLIATFAGALAPPGPVHVNEYAVFTVRAGVVSAPLAAFTPLHAPNAAHEVAFEEFQVSTEVPPEATEAALLSSVTVGVTFTVA